MVKQTQPQLNPPALAEPGSSPSTPWSAVSRPRENVLRTDSASRALTWQQPHLGEAVPHACLQHGQRPVFFSPCSLLRPDDVLLCSVSLCRSALALGEELSGRVERTAVVRAGKIPRTRVLRLPLGGNAGSSAKHPHSAGMAWAAGMSFLSPHPSWVRGRKLCARTRTPVFCLLPVSGGTSLKKMFPPGYSKGF